MKRQYITHAFTFRQYTEGHWERDRSQTATNVLFFFSIVFFFSILFLNSHHVQHLIRHWTFFGAHPLHCSSYCCREVICWYCCLCTR